MKGADQQAARPENAARLQDQDERRRKRNGADAASHESECGSTLINPNALGRSFFEETEKRGRRSTLDPTKGRRHQSVPRLRRCSERSDETYAAHPTRRGAFKPTIKMRTDTVIDGRHRLAAARAYGQGFGDRRRAEVARTGPIRPHPAQQRGCTARRDERVPAGHGASQTRRRRESNHGRGRRSGMMDRTEAPPGGRTPLALSRMTVHARRTFGADTPTRRARPRRNRQTSRGGLAGSRKPSRQGTTHVGRRLPRLPHPPRDDGVRKPSRAVRNTERPPTRTAPRGGGAPADHQRRTPPGSGAHARPQERARATQTCC